MNSDTIAAISTGPGDAGICIIRISGADSLKIADRVFTCSGPIPSERPPRSLVHGTIHSDNGVVDEVILLIMRAPHSYTREDVVEIQGHGGMVSGRRILRCLLDNGIRQAEPGEFTKRAFLNGRIDLLQAEAVADLIRARSDRAAQVALDQLEGRLSSVFNRIYDAFVALAADVEATLDFSEDELAPPIVPQAIERLRAIASWIQDALSTWEEGHVLREGALVVISGKPNVGKSSLLNCMLAKNRVIVSPTPGTTRDTVEETLLIDGIPIRLVDTAGLRAPQSAVEADGVKRARSHMEAADIRIHVVDCSKPLEVEERDELKASDPSRTIVLLNKCDLGVSSYPVEWQPLTAVTASCLDSRGIDDLKRAIVEKTGIATTRPAHGAISERHRGMLARADQHADEARALLESEGEEGLVLVAASLRAAAEDVGSVTGRTYAKDVLDSIFSRFCVGK